MYIVRRKTNNLYYFLYWILILSVIYQDSPFGTIIGEPGKYLTWVFTYVGFLIYIVAGRGRIKIDKNVVALFGLGCWILIVSLLASVVWVVAGNGIVVRNNVLPIKGVELFLTYMAYPMFMVLLLALMNKLSFDQIFRPIFFTLLLLDVICVVEVLTSPYAFRGLHFSASFPYWRVRLLTMESSWTAMMIFVFSVLSLFYAMTREKKVMALLSMASFILLLYFSGSKTLYIVTLSFFILYLLYLLIGSRKKTVKKLIWLLVIIAVGIFAFATIYPLLSASLEGDIKNYTSTATRVYTVFCGIIIGIIFPIGVGALYLDVLPSFISNWIGIIDLLPIEFNTSEVLSYVTSDSDLSVAAKSGIAQYNILWGIVGTIIFFVVLNRCLKRFSRSQYRYKSLLLVSFILIEILFVFMLGFSFENFMLIAVIVYLGKNSEMAKCLKSQKNCSHVKLNVLLTEKQC